MYTTSWITYLFNLFMAYATYYVTYFIDIFREYPIEVRTAAFITVASLIGIGIIRIWLISIRRERYLDKKTARYLITRFGNGINYIISDEASPNMSRREVMRAMGIEKEVAEKTAILKTKREKWIFCLLLTDKSTKGEIKKAHWNNLQMMLTLFGIQEFLEGEVSQGGAEHQVMSLGMLCNFKLHISPWILNKTLESKNIRKRRLAMYAMVISSSDNEFDYYESDFFDKHCCIYDEIELGYALYRRQKSGMKLPNLATWALRQAHPETKCIFVRLMRRFDQKEYCGQLIELYKESKHKKLIEEISRTWGYLYYKDSEQLMTDALLMQPDDTKVAIMHALTRLATGKSLETLAESFYIHTNPHVRYEALRCLYNYGPEGRKRFEEIESQAAEVDKKYFVFFHNPITLEKIRLDKEQAYHPSVEMVYNWS